MALTVEDGTGLAAADAFVSIAYCDTYHSDRGNSTWTGTDAVKEQAIRRATAVLSGGFGWKGDRLQGRDQALAWPRTGVTDGDGNSVPSDEVPTEVQKACAEMALRELVTPGQLTPDVVLSEAVKSAKAGPVSVDFLNASVGPSSSVPILTVVANLISGLLESDGATSVSGKTYRV